MPYKNLEALRRNKAEYYLAHSTDKAAYDRQYRKRKAVQISEYNAAAYAKNKEARKQRAREYYLAHKQERAEYYTSHPEIKLANRKYYAGHVSKFRAKLAKRRAAKLEATPPWLTAEQFAKIEAVYAEAKRLEVADGVKRHVDHIYPLQGKTVCGLHVPWNLQILTSAANLRKSNKLHDPRL
jgi:5-methylcytosine-specific restriction endonuclease McrA